MAAQSGPENPQASRVVSRPLAGTRRRTVLALIFILPLVGFFYPSIGGCVHGVSLGLSGCFPSSSSPATRGVAGSRSTEKLVWEVTAPADGSLSEPVPIKPLTFRFDEDRKVEILGVDRGKKCWKVGISDPDNPEIDIGNVSRFSHLRFRSLTGTEAHVTVTYTP